VNLKKETVIKELEESVNRLEQARSNLIDLHDSGDAHLESIEAFAEVSAEIDGIEAALLIAESRIDELAQILGEEIDDLRKLIEKIEDAD
jgi:exonuclease VII small subunit